MIIMGKILFKAQQVERKKWSKIDCVKLIDYNTDKMRRVFLQGQTNWQ